MCDTLPSSAANQGDNTVSVAQGGTGTHITYIHTHTLHTHTHITYTHTHYIHTHTLHTHTHITYITHTHYIHYTHTHKYFKYKQFACSCTVLNIPILYK